jgi:hypothetical protein
MIGLIIGFSMLVIIGGIFKDRVLANREKQSDGRVK